MRNEQFFDRLSFMPAGISRHHTSTHLVHAKEQEPQLNSNTTGANGGNSTRSQHLNISDCIDTKPNIHNASIFLQKNQHSKKRILYS